MYKVLDVNEVCKEMLEILAEHEVTVCQLDEVLNTLKQTVYTSTCIQKAIKD